MSMIAIWSRTEPCVGDVKLFPHGGTLFGRMPKRADLRTLA
jgi:hypothetical protein